jgi:UDP:flavonoid glycosyltransferase YjiC (YdhE family)
VNIAVTAVGSRGDIQPYVALGRGLQRAGHRVRVLVDVAFADLVEAAGLDLVAVRADPRQALADDLRGIGANPVRIGKWITHHFRPMARDYSADVLAACRGMDAVLFSMLAFPAWHVAEALGIKRLAAYLQPLTPTTAFAHVMAPPIPAWVPLRNRLNWLSAHLISVALFRLIRPIVDECRRDVLGLQPLPWRVYRSLDVATEPVLYGYSAHIQPKPADWGEWLHVTGYWFLEADDTWQPPRALAEFLAEKPAPVYVGFGSMREHGADAATGLVTEALRRAGQRGILLGAAGVSEPERLSETILATGAVPHDWLFPRCAAVVHHGGAGTTSAGLRAGVPAVTVPFFADQFFWGRRLNELGVGPAPIRRTRLTTERLAAAIRTVTGDGEVRRRAADLGARIRAEDGVARAVELVERLLGAG